MIFFHFFASRPSQDIPIAQRRKLENLSRLSSCSLNSENWETREVKIELDLFPLRLDSKNDWTPKLM
jgi:hypothetical protein